MYAFYSGFLSTWSGSDHPEFKLEFTDVNGEIIEETFNERIKC